MVRLPHLAILFLCLNQTATSEVQNKLVRIALVPNTTSQTPANCSLASTANYFGMISSILGLLCDNSHFELYSPESLGALSQDQNITSSLSIVPFNEGEGRL